MSVLHVVAGVLVSGRAVLLAQRPAGKHLGGLWEFPGGKVEPGESAQAALARELGEELGVSPLAAERLHDHTHHYPDKSVRLDLWLVSAWRGELHPNEGQPLRWVSVAGLDNWPMPAADAPAIEKLKLRLG